MRILIAEDDLVSRVVLERTLKSLGYDVVVTGDGRAALDLLCGCDAPQLAILDWMMPELDGVEVCKRVRAVALPAPLYLILLTAKCQTDDVVQGLESGADDYLTKPFDRRELQSRIRVGERILSLQNELTDRVQALQHALAQVHQLQELIPICCYCKRIRNDENYWQQVEGYMASHTGVRFSHGVCPECYLKVVSALEATTP